MSTFKEAGLLLFPLSLLLTLIAAANGASGNPPTPPTCFDDDGNPVDWYVVYKLPLLKGQDYRYSGGAAYAFITSEDLKAAGNQLPVSRSKRSANDSQVFTDDEPMDVDDELDDEAASFNTTMSGQHDDTTVTSSSPVTSGGDSESRNFLQTFKSMLLSYLGISGAPVAQVRGIMAKASPKRKSSPGALRWKLSKKTVNDPNSLVMRTLAVAYDKKNSKLNTIFYNDAPAETDDEDSAKSNMLRAHAKGALIIDEVSRQSVWITHSFPLFPPPRHMPLKFGDNYRKKGQTVMCINFNLDESGDEIAKHLATMYPLVYDSYISDSLYKTLPDLERLKKRRKKTDEPVMNQHIKTSGGFQLELFSKSAALGEDMYSDWMAGELNTKLYVESWRNGGGTALNSTCPKDKYDVNNVHELKLLSDDVKLTWSYRIDHSKWAISETQETGLVCISDVNRMQSQFKRGGGAVCFYCSSCWSAFSNLILEVEPCPVVKKG